VIRRVIFKPEAEADIAEAYDWYESRDAGLGAEFIRCVESCVHGIQRHPEMYPLVHKNLRQGITRRFPYSVCYFVEGETLFIVSVFHASRDPQIWRERI
jgi:plasmid stabilization system protein ParE